MSGEKKEDWKSDALVRHAVAREHTHHTNKRTNVRAHTRTQIHTHTATSAQTHKDTCKEE